MSAIFKLRPRRFRCFSGPALLAAMCFLCLHVFGASHKIRVDDPKAAAALVAGGGRVIADYGGFQIIESETLPAAAFASGRARLADEMNFIRLNARPLNTRLPEIQRQREAGAGFSGRRLRLVQFAAPVKPEWHEQLEGTGVRVIEYIPENAYLVYGDAASIARLRGWAMVAAHVQWDGDYTGEFKVQPLARTVVGARGADGELYSVQLVNDPDANAGTLELIDSLRLAPVRRQFRLGHYHNLIVRLEAGAIDTIAAQPDVISIQVYVPPRKLDERQNQIIAGNIVDGAPSGPDYLDWLSGRGFNQAQFDASGFVVDISDSGVDNGSVTPGHFGLYRLGDPSLPSRVAYLRLEGDPNFDSTLQACDGHGNLGAHIIAGYNNFGPGFPHTDYEGFRHGLGVCPFVRIGSSVVFDSEDFTEPNPTNLQSKAHADGARVSANSWGSELAGAYTVDSQTYDFLTRDARPSDSVRPMAGNQEMVIVFAAGNAGPGAMSLSSPGTAKNVITVGASENVRSLSITNGGNDPWGNDGCLFWDGDADSPEDMTGFSSRGPCADGRIKPDIVAPGTHITGGVGQDGVATTNGLGSALACFHGSGVCGLYPSGGINQPNNFFPLGQQFYTVASGTSFATPAVAGSCALLRQYFLNHGWAAPSAAMTKAFLVNSARYLTGVYANDTLPSNSQGMGEVNLGTAFDGVPRRFFDQLQTNKFTATGQTREFEGTVFDSGKPVRITLAWSDAPGSTVGSAFNNDLDLTVTINGDTYKGNVFTGQFSNTGGTADPRNNVESVFLPAGTTGSFTVTITAANINSDGVPNEAPSIDQDFALVIYNDATAAAPTVILESAAVIDENCPSTNRVVDPGETVIIGFTFLNTSVVSTTNLVATLLATNGVVLPSGPQNFGALANGETVTGYFTFTATGSCGGSIEPTIQLQDGASDLGFASIKLSLGKTTIVSKTFTNGATIAIPGSGTGGSGSASKAAPYPSHISVSGIAGTVTKVTVTLVGFSHDYPEDVDVIVVGPTGAKVMVMSDCGYGFETENITLTIDDSASTPPEAVLPGTNYFKSGTFRSTNYDDGGTDDFSSPAPTGPYGTSLTNFNSLSANGIWSLFVRDDFTGDSGYIAQGWRLSLTTSNLSCCSGVAEADLALTQTVWPAVTNLGGTFSIELAVTNAGPNPALNVQVTNQLPAGLSFISASSSQGTCSTNAGIVSCLLGTMTNNTAATIMIHASATAYGLWTNRAGVGSSTFDFVPVNNSASATIVISDGPPTISSLSPQSVPEDGVLGPLNFVVGDAETAAELLTLSAECTDTNLLPLTGIVFSGSDSNRAVTIEPAPDQNGFCIVSIIVSDGALTATNTFQLTVDPVNDPPVLAAISDWTIHRGMTVVVTNTAVDPDLPPDTLTFGLHTNAPTGATINDGIFLWTPDNSFLNTTSIVSISVIDSGVPQLMDVKTFSVHVLPPPILQTITRSNDFVAITWTAIEGRAYRVQYRTNLTDGGWIDLAPDVIAADETAEWTEAINPALRGFYRVYVVP